MQEETDARDESQEHLSREGYWINSCFLHYNRERIINICVFLSDFNLLISLMFSLKDMGFETTIRKNKQLRYKISKKMAENFVNL